MKTKITKSARTLTIAIEGSIDTVTAPDLDKELQANRDGIDNIILDFTAVDYISSAGLRVVISANQYMEEVNGKLTLRSVNDDVKEVFEMTGFDQFLDFTE